MTTKELQKYVKFCQKNGIKRIKIGTFEMEIDLASYQRDQINKQMLQNNNKVNFKAMLNGISPSNTELSNEDMLFWSVDDPEPQEQTQ